jgi:hypothetical protein
VRRPPTELIFPVAFYREVTPHPHIVPPEVFPEFIPFALFAFRGAPRAEKGGAAKREQNPNEIFHGRNPANHPKWEFPTVV